MASPEIKSAGNGVCPVTGQGCPIIERVRGSLATVSAQRGLLESTLNYTPEDFLQRGRYEASRLQKLGCPRPGTAIKDALGEYANLTGVSADLPAWVADTKNTFKEKNGQPCPVGIAALNARATPLVVIAKPQPTA